MAALSDLYGRVFIVTVCGDAEVFFFDWSKLSGAQRTDFVTRHLGAFAANLAKKKRSLDDFVPVAVLGESIPEEILEDIELSAPHEGTLLMKKGKDNLIYVSAGDDPCAYAAFDSLSKMNPRESCWDRTFEVADLTFGGEGPTEKSGFTIDEFKTQHGGMAMVIGEKSGLFGIIERIRASS